MKEKELRDIFHAYRPEIDDNDAFMDRLTACWHSGSNRRSGVNH